MQCCLLDSGGHRNVQLPATSASAIISLKRNRATPSYRKQYFFLPLSLSLPWRMCLAKSPYLPGPSSTDSQGTLFQSSGTSDHNQKMHVYSYEPWRKYFLGNLDQASSPRCRMIATSLAGEMFIFPIGKGCFGWILCLPLSSKRYFLPVPFKTQLSHETMPKSLFLIVTKLKCMKQKTITCASAVYPIYIPV